MARIPQIYSRYHTLRDRAYLTAQLVWKGFTIPAGFYTDFTTTYWFMRWLVPRYGRSNLAAVLHDWHYTTRTVSRSMADRLYREGCIELRWNHKRNGTGLLSRLFAVRHIKNLLILTNSWLRWIGLRCCGWYFIASKKKAQSVRKRFSIGEYANGNSTGT